MRIPYRTKISRTKLSKFRIYVENFVRRKILSVENFVQYFDTKVRQKLDKIVEMSAWCRKLYPTKYLSDEILSVKVNETCSKEASLF